LAFVKEENWMKIPKMGDHSLKLKNHNCLIFTSSFCFSCEGQLTHLFSMELVQKVPHVRMVDVGKFSILPIINVEQQMLQ
jgi:hypothetical protein